MINRHPALPHELFHIPIAQGIPQIPTHTQQDDLTFKVAPSKKEHIAVITRYTPDLPPVLGTRQELEQVLLNLLVIACHAMPGGGPITITTERRDAQAVVAVTDTGYGIPEEHMSRLFEPFFTTKSPEQGTGLELAVAHQLITGQGGHIDIASRVNQGTTVPLTLPLAEGIHDA
jgi:two-component system NtrC family sensor kinase